MCYADFQNIKIENYLYQSAVKCTSRVFHFLSKEEEKTRNGRKNKG